MGAVVASPVLLGLCCGDPHLAHEGCDPGELPRELLNACEELAAEQLEVTRSGHRLAPYRGPVEMLKEAFAATESTGATSVLLIALDNTSRIHAEVRPMLAVLGLGDCGLLILRRSEEHEATLDAVFNIETVRSKSSQDYVSATKLCRVSSNSERTSVADSMIEQQSFVQCVSIMEGDFLVLGSKVIFESLNETGIIDTCNEFIQSSNFSSASTSSLSEMAEEIVFATYAKAVPQWLTRKEVGDASVVVAEVVDSQFSCRGIRSQELLCSSPDTWSCSEEGFDESPKTRSVDRQSMKVNALKATQRTFSRRFL